MDVEAFGEMRIGGQRVLPAHARDAQRVRQRDVVERIGAGARHGTGHVGDAIMHDVVDHIGRLGMRGRLARFEATALIDRDIDQHRALLHVA